MAIHDPDASAQEKAQALKIGRQKRLQLINGQQVRKESKRKHCIESIYIYIYNIVKLFKNRIFIHCSYFQVEVYTGEVDEDEIMAVEGQDGNQYVVLEVIQLQVDITSLCIYRPFV